MEACEAQHMFRPLHWCSLAGSASAKQLVEMALHGMRGSKAKQLNTETSDAPLQVGAWRWPASGLWSLPWHPESSTGS